MKGKVRQANQSLRYARILGKIMNELLQRFSRLFVALGRLQQAFLQSQIGTRFFVATQFFQVSIISEKTCMVVELERAGRRVEKRNLRARRARTRNLFKIRRGSGKSAGEVLCLGG